MNKTGIQETEQILQLLYPKVKLRIENAGDAKSTGANSHSRVGGVTGTRPCSKRASLFGGEH